MSATLLSRRSFLIGTAAVCVMPPFKVQAQTASEMLIITSRGTVGIGAGSTLSAADSAILGRVGTAIAAKAATRAGATASFNAIAGRFLGMALRASPIALAMAAGLGGAYYLMTGENPLDGLLDLTVGNTAVELRYPVSCGTYTASTGKVSTGDARLGPYNASTTGGCTPRIRMMVELDVSTNPNQSQMTADGWTSEGTYPYRPDPAVNKLSYKFYYTRLIPAGGAVRFPAGTNLKEMLTDVQKAQVIGEGALNAISGGVWKDAQGWKDGGFTGGGGGDFGGGGATGTWEEFDAAAIQNGNTTVRGGIKGSTPPRANPTLGEMVEPRPPVSNPPKFTYPSNPIFPDDAGYDPGAGGGVGDPAPTNPSTGGGTGGSSGGSTGPSCYPGQVQCPTKVDWGLPPSSDTDSGLGAVNPMDWFPSPFTPPAVNASCTGFEQTFPILGHVNINPCPVLDQAFPVIRPMVILGGTVEAGRVLLDM